MEETPKVMFCNKNTQKFKTNKRVVFESITRQVTRVESYIVMYQEPKEFVTILLEGVMCVYMDFAGKYYFSHIALACDNTLVQPSLATFAEYIAQLPSHIKFIMGTLNVRNIDA
eukprot:10847136-Ditylum_brightwellii.AAC.1